MKCHVATVNRTCQLITMECMYKQPDSLDGVILICSLSQSPWTCSEVRVVLCMLCCPRVAVFRCTSCRPFTLLGGIPATLQPTSQAFCRSMSCGTWLRTGASTWEQISTGLFLYEHHPKACRKASYVQMQESTWSPIVTCSIRSATSGFAMGQQALGRHSQRLAGKQCRTGRVRELCWSSTQTSSNSIVYHHHQGWWHPQRQPVPSSFQIQINGHFCWHISIELAFAPPAYTGSNVFRV